MEYIVSTKTQKGKVIVDNNGIIINSNVWIKWIGKDFGKLLEKLSSFGLQLSRK